jgi:TRAP-type uncharacterized transport system substrate-binding protein
MSRGDRPAWSPSDPQSPRRRALPLPAVPLTPSALRSAGLPALAMLSVLTAVLALLLWGAWRLLEPIPSDRQLVIATGPQQSAYEAFGERYRTALSARRMQVELRLTAGAADNLSLLLDPGSGVDAAFVQGGVPLPVDTRTKLVSLGSVAVEPLWLFYRRASLSRLGLPRGAWPDRLAQLAPWRVDIGPAGGGSAPLMRRLAADQGLGDARLVAREAMAVQRVVALVQGQVDALALVSAADAPLVQYLLATPEVAVFDFGQADAAARRLEFLRPLVLPRGVIKPAEDVPSRDLRMVAATASLVVRADLHPALMQMLLQTAQSVHGEAGWFNRSAEYPRADADSMPLADEAARYYRDGPPWMQRHLPFWLATFIDRMWIVLLPLAAALVPLSRILPPLVTMRLRSRIYRWYADLRRLEFELEQPDADLKTLAQWLEQLETKIERIGVPLAFTAELYDLRAHIKLVRERLQGRTQPH